MEIDKDDYSNVEKCNDVALLTGVFKLFLREIHEPLIPATIQLKLVEIFKAESNQKPEVFSDLRKAMEIEMFPVQIKVTRFLFKHLKRVAEEEKNMMTTRNIAVVFAPNIFHSVSNSPMINRCCNSMYEEILS